ncbi:MAG: hypothetical protein ACKV2T_36305 [Kofleriaceae bacterium]
MTNLANIGCLALALVVGSAVPAFAEDLYTTATKVSRVEDVVWALTATCANHGTDTEQRQCRQLRDVRVKEMATQTMLVEGDATAFTVGAFDAAKKSAQVSLSACVYCSPIAVESKSYTVFGGTPRLVDGAVKPPMLHDTTQTFADAAAHTAWKQKVAAARVDLVVKVPDKKVWSVGGKSGLAFDIVGYRVVVPCTGEVVIAKPASLPVEPDKKSCTVSK